LYQKQVIFEQSNFPVSWVRFKYDVNKNEVLSFLIHKYGIGRFPFILRILTFFKLLFSYLTLMHFVNQNVTTFLQSLKQTRH